MNEIPMKQLRLCSVCNKFDVRALLIKSEAQGPPKSGNAAQVASFTDVHASVPRFFAHQPNLTTLRCSSDDCDLCSSIWQQYCKIAQPFELTDDALASGLGSQQIFLGSTQWGRSLHGLPSVAAFQYGPRGETRTLAWFEVYASRGSVPRDYGHLTGRSTFENGSSDACLAVAIEMLQTCRNHHVKCNVPRERTVLLPTRVLQIDNLQNAARLVDTDGPLEPFVALSYCWGGESTLTLTSASESVLRDGLPIELFPATLRDALIVTKKLRLSFIWIDALCILQDSAEDWKREASKMRDVYKGAVVTLNAASAAKTSDGIFSARPQNNVRCILQWRNNQARAQYVCLRSGLEFADMTLRTCKISTRAWTLQETLLAPRTLHFGPQQIAFECANGRVDEAGRHTTASEEYSSKAFLQELYSEQGRKRKFARWTQFLGILPVLSIPYYSVRHLWENRNTEMNRTRARRHFNFHFKGFLKTPGGIYFTYYDLWREIVNRYSSRSLTYDTDVLLALAGLAEEFQRVTGDTYIAGMWKGDFIRCLNWVRGPLQRKSKDGKIWDIKAPTGYLGPSWSWASVLGKSTSFLGSYPCQEDTRIVSKVKVLDVHVETDTSGQFGKIKSGFMKLRGRTTPIKSPLEIDNKDENLPTTHAYLSRLINIHEFGSEFLQSHVPVEAQLFSLLHLCTHRDLSNTLRTSNYLLLESCPDGSWKRIGNLGIQENGRQMRNAPPQANNDVRLELKEARWETRSIEIV